MMTNRIPDARHEQRGPDPARSRRRLAPVADRLDSLVAVTSRVAIANRVAISGASPKMRLTPVSCQRS
jgi:hypothetical protein